MRLLRSKSRAARERLARTEEAEAELSALYGALREAYALFDRTSDPALAEACILQIGALRSRCGVQLRALKELDAESKGGTRFAAPDPDRTHHRRRTHGAAAEASEKAHQMDP